MSEYQYYEFRSIDQFLTEDQVEDIRSLSSRASVYPHQAVFVYNYGDFRGNVEQLMTEYFDIMLYMANWGSRRLMFRIPHFLFDIEQATPYCIPGNISIYQSDDKEDVIIDLNLYREELGGWAEGEGWLDNLIDLREDLIKGDFRILYLSWLSVVMNIFGMSNIDNDLFVEDDIDPNRLEPPVSAGLKNLSLSLKSFVDFLQIGEALIEVAAQKSEELQEEPQKETPETGRLIQNLSEDEKNDFLVRLSRGEKNLSTLFNRRLNHLAAGNRPQKEKVSSGQRTASGLITEADKLQQKKIEKEKIEAERARREKFKELAANKDQLWQEIYSLIEEKKIKAYDMAVVVLKDLYDLADYEGELSIFNGSINEIVQAYSKRPGLLARMKDSGLIKK